MPVERLLSDRHCSNAALAACGLPVYTPTTAAKNIVTMIMQRYLYDYLDYHYYDDDHHDDDDDDDDDDSSNDKNENVLGRITIVIIFAITLIIIIILKIEQSSS